MCGSTMSTWTSSPPRKGTASSAPSPPHTGQVLVMISRTPSVTFWRVISTSPSGEISTTKVFVRSSSRDLRSVFRTVSRLRARAMSMKSMTMIPPMSRSLALAGEGARVDVDDRQRLGVVDHQVAAAGQVDAAVEHALDDRLDAVGLEQRLLLGLPQLHAVHELRRGAREERDQPMVLLGVVDDRALEVLGEDVAHDADREVGLLEDQGGRGRLGDALLEHVVELEEVLQLALEVRPLRAVRRGADDRAAAAEVELLGLLAQAVALLVLQAARDAHALAPRGVDHVAAGDRELHRQARALGLERVLDDLYDDLLPWLEQVGDARLAGAAAALDLLDARDDDLVDVQEAVLVEADVDEGGLGAGQDVVDDALVDVADDRAATSALEVDLGDAVPLGDRAFLAAL